MIFTFLTLFLFTSGHPYGLIWTRMDPYISLCCFYMNYMCFLHCVYMILDGCLHYFLDFRHILKTHFTHIFITFLENYKDHFPSPPAPKFALLCKIRFPRCWNVPGQILIFYLNDFLLLCLRDEGVIVIADEMWPASPRHIPLPTSDL